MNHEHMQAYGLWSLMILNSAVFIFFAFSFTHPETKRDWRSLGAFSGFILALFAEMYGFPLTIYFFSGWIGKHYPGTDPFSHDAGHLWHTLLGLKGNPHLDIFHLLSNFFVIGGFFLLASSWKVLFQAQKQKCLAVSGPYRHVRHPQYDAFVLIMFGFLLQWPTLLTLAMFPVLVWMYIKLSAREEAEVKRTYGDEYLSYAARVPRFFPKLGQTSQQPLGEAHQNMSSTPVHIGGSHVHLK